MGQNVAADVDSRAWTKTPPKQRALVFSPERGWLLPVILLILLFFLTVVPLITVVIGSFRPQGLPLSNGWTFDHYAEIWGSPYTYRLFLNTLVFAFGSTFLAIVLALALAWLLERTDMPGAGGFRAAILMPMATPPLLLAIGWVLIMSPKIGLIPTALSPFLGSFQDHLNFYSLGGMIFVQGMAYVPTAFLILAPMVRNLDPTFEEAAIISGASPLQTLRRVSLPFLTPSLLSVGTLLVIIGMLTFDVPAIVGLPGNVWVMSSEIFNLMNPTSGIPRYGESAALNSSLFILLIGGLLIYSRTLKHAERFAAIGGKGYKARRFPLGRWRTAAVCFVALYFMGAVVLPFGALLWASLVPYFSGFKPELFSQLSFKAYSETFANPRFVTSLTNSAIIAAVASIGLGLLSLILAWTVVRSRLAWVRVLDVMAMIPIAVPHLMMGVALVFLFFSFRAIPLYGTIWIIALGHLIVYLPLGARMMQAGVLQINRELEEAATVSGASLLQNLRRVVAPLLKGTIFAFLIWMIVHSLREFSVAVMLQSGRNEVLSTILFSFWETGEPERAAAIAVMLMGVLVLLVFAMGRLTRNEEK
jgi:iron(III) transport system permease protein